MTAATPRLRALLLVATSAAALAAFALGFLPETQVRLARLALLGPALVQMCVALAAFALLAHAVRTRVWRAAPAARAEVLGLALACGILVLGLVHVVPQRMRIQEDEALLGATALALARGQPAIAPTAAWVAPDGAMRVLSTQLDQHRLAFPVLLSLMHRALGYAADNGLLLNALLGWGLALCLCLVGRARGSAALGFAWAAAFAFTPLYIASQASAGLEVVNLFFLALSLLVAESAVRSREPALLICVLAILGPLLAQSRTESVLPALAFYALALYLTWRAPTRLTVAALALAPLLYLPAAWHLAKPYAVRAELLDEHASFALRYLIDNTKAAFEFLVEPSELDPVAPFPLAIAGAGLVALLVAAVKRRVAWSTKDLPLAVFVLGALAGTAVNLVYVWGNVYIAISARMLLVALLLLAFAMVATLAWARRAFAPRVPLELIACLLLAVPSLDAARGDLLGDMQEVAPAQHVVRDWARHVVPRCRLLIATSSSTYFMLQGWSTMTAPQAYAQWGEVRRRYAAGEFDAVVGVQLDDLPPWALSPTAPVLPGYVSREVFEERPGQMSPLRVVLINSREQPLVPRADSACVLNALMPQ